MNLVNHNDRIVEHALAVFAIGRTSILFQLIGRDAVVANEFNARINHGHQLFTDIVLLLRGQVLTNGFFEIGHPYGAAFLRAGQHAFQVLLLQGEDVLGVYVAHAADAAQRLGHPVIIHAEVAESAKGHLVHKVGAQGERRHDDDFLVRRAIKRLGRRDGGTRLA